jgi:hypothetical protein
MWARSWRRRSKRTLGSDGAEFDYCLACGAPLTSWLSRRDGFGLQCAERLPRAHQARLRALATAAREDLAQLAQERGRTSR